MVESVQIANRRSGRAWAWAIRIGVILGIAGCLAVGQIALGAYVTLSKDLPAIPPFDDIRFGSVSTVRASHGQVLGERFEERRYLIPYEHLPDVLVQAFIASEDKRFFEHGGVDVLGVLRAIWTNLRAGRVREGASTITQQLARSLLLSNEQTYKRKIREAAVARRIEDIYTKDQILLLYLNLIYLGSRYYGVQAAALGYFGKDVSELSVSEAAAISASAQTPHRVNPARSPDEIKERRDRVIHRMTDAGFIDRTQAEEALGEQVRTIARKDNLGDRAPVPAMELMGLLKTLEGGDQEEGLLVSRGGVTAVSTIDLGFQRAAQAASFRAGLALGRRQGFLGPLATLPEGKWDTFARRNGQWMASLGPFQNLPDATLLLALVTSTSRKKVEVRLSPDIRGTLPLAHMKWAIPYTEFPLTEGDKDRRRRSGRVSLDGRLKKADTALSPGDVVLVSRAEPPKKKKRRKKKTDEPVPAEAPPELFFALEQFPRPQAALLAVEPRSGYVQAMSGGTDFDLSQFNRTTSLRQIGSTVKPVYYAKAYDIGIPPSTVVSGVPFREGAWTPTRGRTVDDMTLYEALTRSENNVSLRVFKMVLDRVGVEGLNEWIGRLGLNRPFEGYPAEGLGVDSTPQELLKVFSTIANQGIRPDFSFIKVVRDNQGRILRDHRSARDATVPIRDALSREVALGPDASRRAITAEVAWIVSENLRRVVESGTARRARKLDKPVSGKTGTLPYDVWFVGWTPELAAVTWVGEDRRTRYLGRSKVSSRVYGSDTALPAWLDFMKVAIRDRPEALEPASSPEGIIEVEIDPATGLLAREGGLLIPHLSGTEPVEFTPEPWDQPAGMELAEF